MSWRDPRIGDVLVVRGRRLLGRVVATDAVVGPTHGCVLVYVYRDQTLSRDALLVPPMLTTRAPFFRGMFERWESRPLLPGDYFEVHAFRDASGQLFDEQERPLDHAPEGVPVGEHRLLDAEAVNDAITAVPGGYELAARREPQLGEVREAVRELARRWQSAFGRPPTRAEWESLYEEPPVKA